MLRALHVLALITAAAHAAVPRTADVLVYGGTASGILAAYSAAHEGQTVILLEPTTHLGGMVTGGLSATDLGNFKLIGGYTRDFYLRAAAHYGLNDLNNRANWRTEPHVSADIFASMLKEANIDVHLHQQLREHHGVTLLHHHIVSITTTSGLTYRARVFIDATYDGDLLAQSGAAFTTGRESTADFDEPLAGVRLHSPNNGFPWPLSAYSNVDHVHLLPEISSATLAAPGTGDKNIEAYDYRVLLTQDPANRLPIPQPAHYTPERFALLSRYLDSFQPHLHRDPTLNDILAISPIPGNKAEFNSRGPVSTDYIGHSQRFPNASDAEKRRIADETFDYVRGFFYFLSHDPAVPPSLQREINTWGLPRDEFPDTAHWPGQLFIREARRMQGAYILRQSDLQTARTKPDSIGMSSRNSGSHSVQRVALPDGTVFNEGDVLVPVKPFEIPYRILTPEKSQVDNLLVPVCVSATHIGYSALRLEPQYMILGQAAGTAAAIASKASLAVQDVPIPQLQQTLRAHRAILHQSEAAR